MNSEEEFKNLSPEKVIKFVESFLTKERILKIEKVLEQRTLNVTVVLEGVYDLGNVNAVMRTAEALGYQSLHLIKKDEEFRIANRVTRGADHWVDLHRWNSVSECISDLKTSDFQIFVTDLNSKNSIYDIDFTKKIALVLGNEMQGISDELKKHADFSFFIPMGGFAQSFNISVAAALALYHIREDRLHRQGFHGDLSPEEKLKMKAKWYLNSVNNPQEILKHLLVKN